MARRSSKELDQNPTGGTIPIAVLLDGSLPDADGSLPEADGSLPEADGSLPEADGSITTLVFFESQSISPSERVVHFCVVAELDHQAQVVGRVCMA